MEKFEIGSQPVHGLGDLAGIFFDGVGEYLPLVVAIGHVPATVGRYRPLVLVEGFRGLCSNSRRSLIEADQFDPKFSQRLFHILAIPTAFQALMQNIPDHM